MPAAKEIAKQAAASDWTAWSHEFHLLIGLAIMVLAGILGFHCRHIFEERHKKASWSEIMIPGVVASFVVPLFLGIGKK